MMPSAMRLIWPYADSLRVRLAGTLKLAVLLGAVLSPLAAPGAAEAQGFIARANTSRTVVVEFGRGGPDQDGYESARVPVAYHIYACRGLTPGSVFVTFGLKPENATASSAYWYEGRRYEATGRPVVRSALLDATATSPGGEVGSMQREATPASSMPADCERGGVNFTNLGLVSPFADPTNPAAVAQFLNTVTLSVESMSQPLRNSALEQDFARQRRAAETAAADSARAAQAAKERQLAETRAAAQPNATPVQPAAGSTGSDTAAVRAQTPEQAEAADRAARVEAARRAAEEAQAEAERQQAAQEDLIEAAGEVGRMAALSGGAVGGYYFTGGDPSSSLYQFTELTGMGFGFNFGPMILELGQMTGTYSEYFVEDYAEENGGLLPESGEVTGMFLHVGMQFQKTFDSFRLGASGGYLYGYTDDAEVSSPTLGLIMGYSMLKFRYDIGLGDESTAGYALYLQF